MVIIGQQESQFLKAEVLKKLKIGNKRGHPDWGYQFTNGIPKSGKQSAKPVFHVQS